MSYKKPKSDYFNKKTDKNVYFLQSDGNSFVDRRTKVSGIIDQCYEGEITIQPTRMPLNRDLEVL